MSGWGHGHGLQIHRFKRVGNQVHCQRLMWLGGRIKRPARTDWPYDKKGAFFSSATVQLDAVQPWLVALRGIEAGNFSVTYPVEPDDEVVDVGYFWTSNDNVACFSRFVGGKKNSRWIGVSIFAFSLRVPIEAGDPA